MCNLRDLFCCFKSKKRVNIPVPSFLPISDVNNLSPFIVNQNNTQPIKPLVLPLVPTPIFPKVPTTPPRYNNVALPM